MKLVAIAMLSALGGVLSATPCFASAITITYNAGDGCSGSSSGPAYSTTCTGVTLGAVTSVAAEASLTTLKLSLDSAGTSLGGRSAEVRVTDTFTVTGGTGGGTLVWNWAIDGTLAAGDTTFSEISLSNLGGAPFADFRACGNNVAFGGFVCNFPLDANVAVNETASISIPFQFGVATTVDWRLRSLIVSGCYVFVNCGGAGVDADGTVDFFNTLQLQPLVVLDSTGIQVAGGSVLSDSGFSYAVASTANEVPEPTSLALLASGLISAGARRWRQRNARLKTSVRAPSAGRR
jgi:hypothetical protein